MSGQESSRRGRANRQGRAKRLRVIVEADGGARGNPGPAGYGAVVREAGTGEILIEVGDAIGVATNNVAEYRGLIAGLQGAADLGAVEVDVRMDSKLVVEQMSGRWQIKHPGLRPLAAEAAALVRRFETVRFSWVPREENRHADALANAAMDGKSIADVDVPRPADGGGEIPSPARTAPGTAVAGGAAPRSWAPPSGVPATRLVLVRHGETEFTAQRRYSGRGDVPLTQQGRAQAKALASRLASLNAAAVYSSPLSRCVATAEAIARAQGGPPVRVEPDLIECDFGEWEGLTFAEVRAGWPELMDQWLASPAVAAPGGESFETVAERVRGVLPRLLEAHPAETVVLVSHVAPIKLLLRDALAAGDAFLYRLYLDAAAFSIVDFWPDGAIAVRTVNDTSHL